VEVDTQLDIHDAQVAGVSAASWGIYILEPIAIVLTIIMQSLAIAFLVRKHIILGKDKKE